MIYPTIITIVLTLSSSLAFGQKLKFKHIKFEDYQEQYYINRSSKQKDGSYIKFRSMPSGINVIESGQFKDGIRDGTWYFFYFRNSLKSEGIYKNRMKVGIWKTYFFNQSPSLNGNTLIANGDSISISVQAQNKNLKSIGNFDRGIKTGIWSYYDKHSDLVHQFDHSSGKLLSRDSSKLNLNRTPIYLGGNESLIESIKMELLPLEVIGMRRNIEFLSIEISLVIGKSGDTQDILINKSSGFQDADRAFIQSINSIDNNWIPALEEGEGRKEEVIIRLNYKREKITESGFQSSFQIEVENN
ncbi:MAG: hypothetical protein RIC35_07800 [Marinoscillum sp.]